MVKIVATICIFITGLLSLSAQKSMPNNKALNSRSDTIDILNYQINLTIIDFTNKKISGSCNIKFTPKINGINTIGLDLLKLTVDSIKMQNNLLTFSYNDTLLTTNLATLLNIGDTASLIVYYHGTPQIDASGWGGFYFQGNYAYNLGVGFDANPHNYGRVWFPCFDNFVERSTYQFNIITANGKNAHCNGKLDTTYTIAGDTIMNSWSINKEIPSYLVCVAVADYATVHTSHVGIFNDTIPIELVARASDTTNMKNSFLHLNNAIDIYETHYGQYRWNKIGYSLVPFSSGAMEHVTNIAFPQAIANGTLTYETLMAHEFSHHWWGDLVTCETEGDMWINEGMAVYSEHLFLEGVYGYPTSLAAIKKNHKEVLQFTYLNESGYRAISGIPHQYTYGDHTYKKGASVIHNMRAYMGDSLFFVGLKAIINNYQYKSINAYQYRDELIAATGINMTNFFNDWVFSPGFSHFSIDSSVTTANGSNYNVTLHIKQKLRGAPNFHTGTPLEITFYDVNWNRVKRTIIASGQNTTTSVTIPFNPILILLNEDNKLNQARTDDKLIIKNTGSNNLSLSLSTVTVNSITDSALLFVEHHWVAPDSIKNNPNNYRISTSRYWSFQGILPQNFKATVKLNFDGRANNGYLDVDLVPVNGDSIILLYRKDAKDDWTVYPYYTKTTVGPTIPFGFITIDSLILGEYTFANGVLPVAVKNNIKQQQLFNVYPNPTKNFLWIESKSANNNLVYLIYDMNGKIVAEGKLNKKVKINTTNWVTGSYIVKIKDVNNLLFTKKIIVQ